MKISPTCVILGSISGVLTRICMYIYIEDIQINTDPENSLILVETNLPTLVWQGLC